MRRKLTESPRGQVSRPAGLALALALFGVAVAHAAAAPATRLGPGAWRRIELPAERTAQPFFAQHPRTRSPAAVTADPVVATRRRAVRPPVRAACTAGVVADLVEVGDLAIDDRNIYFVDGADWISRVAKEGGTPTLLGEVPGSLIVSLAIDDARVYFAAYDDRSLTGTIYSIAKEGGPVRTLVRGLATPYDLAVDGQFIYWVAVGTVVEDEILADGAIGRAMKDGSGAVKLASNLSIPISLATDTTYVYFGEVGDGRGNSSAGLRRVSVTGGAVEKLLDGTPVGAVAVDGAAVYFVTVDLAGMLEIRSVPKSGGTSRVLVSGLDDAAGLKVWGSTLYYASNVSEVISIAAVLVGGGPSRTVKLVELATPEIALDDCLVYFATNSTLDRAPR